MDKSTFFLYASLICFSAFFCFISCLLVSKNVLISRKRKINFIIGFTLVTICSFLELGGKSIDAFNHINNNVYAALKSIEYCLVPIIAFFIGIMFYDKGILKWFQLSLAGINIVIVIFNVFFKFLYNFSDTGVYTHGSFYWIYLVIYILSTLFSLVQGFRMMHQYDFKNWYQLMLAAVCLVGAIIIQGIIGVPLDFFALSICSLLIYVFITEVSGQTDSVTGLYNRKTFDVRFSELEDNSVIAIIDIDLFKDCNDKYGHRFGDEVLKILGEEVFKLFHKYGMCFRIGGDEFAIIMTKNIEKCSDLFAQLDKEIGKITAENIKLPSISYGYAKYNARALTPEETFNIADELLYKRKESKKVEDKSTL